MISTTANFDTYNAKTVKKPVWVLEFDGITTYFCTGNFSGITSSYKKYIKDVRFTSTMPHFLSNSGGATYAEVTLVDKNQELVSFLSANNILGVQATLKYGFQELSISDFATRFIGRVREYPFNSFEEVTIVIEDFAPKFGEYLFELISETTLAGQIGEDWFATTLASGVGSGSNITLALTDEPNIVSAGDVLWLDDGAGTTELVTVNAVNVSAKTITVDTLINSYSAGTTVNNSRIPLSSSAGFLTSITSSINPPYQDGMFVKIGNEIIKYDSVDTANHYLILNVSSNRGALNTQKQRHASGTRVVECFVLRDNPINLLLYFLTTTATGTNGGFDIGLPNWGLEVDANFVDLGGWITVRDSYFGDVGDTMQFAVTQRETGLDLIRNEILIPCGIMMYIDGSGRIAPRKLDTLTSAASVASLSDSDIVLSPPNIAIEEYLNRTEWHYDYDAGLNQYRKMRSYRIVDSVTTYGQSEPLIIQSRGLSSSYNHQDFIDDLHTVLTKRYGNPPLLIDCELTDKLNTLEAGDVVTVTATNYPDLANGDRGISAQLAQIRRIEIGTSGPPRALLEMPNQIDFVSVGSSTTVDTSDINSTPNSTATANYNTTDSDAVQADDAKYDVSAGVAVSATQVIVKVSAVLQSGDGVQVRVRVGTGVDTATMTTTASQNISYTASADEIVVLTYTFNGLTLGQYDVKVDYWSRAGATAPASVQVVSITYETDGVSYAEIT